MSFYYVHCDSGSPGNSGTSNGDPWLDLPYAQANIVPDPNGDTIFVAGTQPGTVPSLAFGNYQPDKNKQLRIILDGEGFTSEPRATITIPASGKIIDDSAFANGVIFDGFNVAGTPIADVPLFVVKDDCAILNGIADYASLASQPKYIHAGSTSRASGNELLNCTHASSSLCRLFYGVHYCEWDYNYIDLNSTIAPLNDINSAVAFSISGISSHARNNVVNLGGYAALALTGQDSISIRGNIAYGSTLQNQRGVVVGNALNDSVSITNNYFENLDQALRNVAGADVLRYADNVHMNVTTQMNGGVVADPSGNTTTNVSWLVDPANGDYRLTSPLGPTSIGGTTIGLLPISPSTNPDVTTGFLTVRDDQLVGESGVTVKFRMVSPPDGTGEMFDRSWFTVTSDAAGLVEAPLAKGATYEIAVAGCRNGTKTTIPVGAGDTHAITNFATDR